MYEGMGEDMSAKTLRASLSRLSGGGPKGMGGTKTDNLLSSSLQASQWLATGCGGTLVFASMTAVSRTGWGIEL
jgi:hypothetical protein